MIIATFIIIYFRFIIGPEEKIKQLENQTKELNETVEKLKQNATIIENPIIKKADGWQTFWFFVTVVLGVLLLIFILKSNQQKLWNKEELIRFFRGEGMENKGGYSLKKEAIKLFTCVKYHEGFYKADFNLPIALLVFSTDPNWIEKPVEALSIQIPPKSYIRAFLVSRKNPNDIKEDWVDTSLENIYKQIKDTVYGFRLHYEAYKLSSPQEEALEALREAKFKEGKLDEMSAEEGA